MRNTLMALSAGLGLSLAAFGNPAAWAQGSADSPCQDITLTTPIQEFTTVADWERVVVVLADGTELEFTDVALGQVLAAPGTSPIVRLIKCASGGPVAETTPTPTPPPTATPTPESTVTPAPTPEATATPIPSATETPPATPIPTVTPTATPTTQATVTPQPTATPGDVEVLGRQEERLAETGDDTLPLVVVGGSLVGVGAVAIGVARRRADASAARLDP